ncbi:MAG: hypothetical protein HY537_09920 [Deltaproteobacteria bacterium]|nr:hypothetical protein [Deltaproteobacteria bacterium]
MAISISLIHRAHYHYFKTVGVLALLLLVACSSPQPETAPKPPALGQSSQDTLLIVTADHGFQTSDIRTIDLATGKANGHYDRPSSDVTMIRVPGGSDRIYVVNSTASNIQVISRKTGKTIAQHSVGRNSLPQDILIWDDSNAFISLGRSHDLLQVRFEQGAMNTLHSVSLRGLAPGAVDFPGMYRMTRVGDRLLVQLQRLHYWEPAADAVLAVLNVANQTAVLEKTIPLHFRNPFSDFKRGPDGSLYTAQAGSWNDNGDGGIEKINSQLTASEVVVDGKSLGGDPEDFEILGETLGVAVIAPTMATRQLVSFDPVKKKKIADLTPVLTYPSLCGVVYDRSRHLLYVCDRSLYSHRIRILNQDLRENSVFGFDLPPWLLVLAD